MPLYGMTKEEHTQAVLAALEETYQRNSQSKEAAKKFLINAGIFKEEDFKPKTKSKTKKV